MAIVCRLPLPRTTLPPQVFPAAIFFPLASRLFIPQPTQEGVDFFPALPAFQGERFALSQSGLSGKVLDSAMGAGIDLAHKPRKSPAAELKGRRAVSK
jgi:hypothetical protein